MNVTPPKWARALLEWSLPRDAHDDIVGDLDEEWRGRRVWYWAHAVAIAARFILERRREPGVGLPPGRADRWGAELRFAARMFARHPSRTLVAVGTLALGIGLTTTAFSIVYGSLYRGLPVEDSERLVHFERENLEQGRNLAVTPHDYDFWRSEQRSFEGLGAYVEAALTLMGEDGVPERARGLRISANAFSLLRTRAALGRVFTEEEDRSGGPPVMAPTRAPCGRAGRSWRGARRRSGGRRGSRSGGGRRANYGAGTRRRGGASRAPSAGFRSTRAAESASRALRAKVSWTSQTQAAQWIPAKSTVALAVSPPRGAGRDVRLEGVEPGPARAIGARVALAVGARPPARGRSSVRGRRRGGDRRPPRSHGSRTPSRAPAGPRARSGGSQRRSSRSLRDVAGGGPRLGGCRTPETPRARPPRGGPRRAVSSRRAIRAASGRRRGSRPARGRSRPRSRARRARPWPVGRIRPRARASRRGRRRAGARSRGPRAWGSGARRGGRARRARARAGGHGPARPAREAAPRARRRGAPKSGRPAGEPRSRPRPARRRGRGRRGAPPDRRRGQPGRTRPESAPAAA